MFVLLSSTKIVFLLLLRMWFRFVAMATLSFHKFIMGKVKVDLYFDLTLGILTKAL